MKPLPYYHVDVFSNRPFSGNGLTVFPEAEGLSKDAMLAITREMRQFESIFLENIGPGQVRAHVFTCDEEVDFAGHPVLGAAATLHDLQCPNEQSAEWSFVLNKKTINVITQRNEWGYKGTMNQGAADFGMVLDDDQIAWLLGGLNLSIGDLYPACRPLVVSTGLPYVLVPLKSNALKAKIGFTGMEEIIRSWGAMFVGVLEIPTLTIRTGDNFGRVEDIATGSLAGPSGAFLVERGINKADTMIKINQGEHLGRPSALFVEVKADGDIYVSGDVCKIAQGTLVTAAG